MNIEYIIIVLGEPYSTFSEILGKYFNKQKRIKKNNINWKFGIVKKTINKIKIHFSHKKNN